MDIKDGIKKLEEQFGSRYGFLGYQVINLSMLGQPCDITFYKKKPALNIKIDQNINIALMYGAGANKLKELLENIKLSNGDVVSISEIWTINPMPVSGFTDEELASVDLSLGEEKAGPNGETLREMISETYHCNSPAEVEKFLRRFIAS